MENQSESNIDRKYVTEIAVIYTSETSDKDTETQAEGEDKADAQTEAGKSEDVDDTDTEFGGEEAEAIAGEGTEGQDDSNTESLIVVPTHCLHRSQEVMANCLIKEKEHSDLLQRPGKVHFCWRCGVKLSNTNVEDSGVVKFCWSRGVNMQILFN
eukprot:m.180300 g.180300  ORF g.180300 m.180300 type:complete len:155 (+) comp39243_c0_seq18:1911-2375(+)